MPSFVLSLVLCVCLSPLSLIYSQGRPELINMDAEKLLARFIPKPSQPTSASQPLHLGRPAPGLGFPNGLPVFPSQEAMVQENTQASQSTRTASSQLYVSPLITMAMEKASPSKRKDFWPLTGSMDESFRSLSQLQHHGQGSGKDSCKEKMSQETSQECSRSCSQSISEIHGQLSSLCRSYDKLMTEFEHLQHEQEALLEEVKVLKDARPDTKQKVEFIIERTIKACQENCCQLCPHNHPKAN